MACPELVAPTPIMTLLTTTILVGEPITLDLSSSFSLGGNIKKWSLYWGDGTVISGTGKPGTVSHIYETAGTYEIVLTITNSRRLSASSWSTIVVSAVDPVPAPTTLLLTVPADISEDSSSGGPIVITYPAASASGGTAPYTFTYAQAGGALAPSGSIFPVGTTTIYVTVRSADGQEVTDTFDITVIDALEADTTPDPFSFASVSDAALSADYTSNPITLSGLTAATPITITDGTYSVNGSFYMSGASTVENGDVVRVRLTSSSSYLTQSVATLTIGGVSGIFSVTTTVGDTVPDQFSFTAKLDQPLSTEVTSDPVTITGITVTSNITITDGTYSINGGTFTSSAGSVNAGDIIRVKVTSSSSNSTIVSSVVTIGGISATFSVKTLALVVAVVPTAPSGLTVLVSSSVVQLNWTDNSLNETGFKIERKITGGIYNQIATIASNTVVYYDSSITPNTTYTYRVRAYNSVGNSTYSNEVVAVVPAAPPAPVTSANHPYYSQLVTRSDFWVEHSLRDPAKLTQYKATSARPEWVTYDSTEDAAKVTVPDFDTVAVLRVDTPIDASQTTIQMTIPGSTEAAINAYMGGSLTSGSALKLDNEIVTVVRTSGVSITNRTVTVVRAQHSTTGASHISGTLCRPSVNSLQNIVRLPLNTGTQDGNTYIFSWDHKWDPSYLRGNTGLDNYKTWMFAVNSKHWHQIDTRFTGQYGSFTATPGFNALTDIGVTGARNVDPIGGNADWTLNTTNKVGPNVTTSSGNVSPQAASFIIKPNVWNRYWVRFIQRANDYDLFSMWAASATVAPVRLFNDLQMSIPLPNSINQFWLEYNTSTSALQPGRGYIYSWVRNFVGRRGAADIDLLLSQEGL